MTHTPSPWLIDASNDDYVEVRGDNGSTVLIETFHSVPSSIREQVIRETRANAHLIAAAPELYEALEKAEQWLMGWASAETELAVIRAALSKARGEV